MITIRLETPDHCYLLDPDCIIADLTERLPGTRVTVEDFHEWHRNMVRDLVAEYAAKGKPFLIEKRVLEEINEREIILGPARRISIPLNDQGNEIEGLVAASRVHLGSEAQTDFETVRTIVNYLNSLAVGQLSVRDDKDPENQRRLKTLTARQQMQLDGEIDLDDLLLPPLQRNAVDRLREEQIKVSAGIKYGALNFGVYVLDTNETDHLCESMRELTPIANLSIQNSPLTERGLATLAGLPRLHDLHLNNSATPGSAFRHLASFPRLTKLCVDEMELNDDALAAIGELYGLRRLRFKNSLISDNGFRKLAQLQKLATLHLSQVPVDWGLQELVALERLEFLDLSNMPQVTGDILAVAGQLSRLEGLGLQLTTLTDTDLNHLRGLKQLRQMTLHYTGEATDAPRLTPEGLQAFADLPELKKLTLIKVPLDDERVRQLGQLSQLRYLGLNLPGISPEMRALLKQRLPECHIHWVNSKKTET